MERISYFRVIAIMEGISFLVLLFIAMPLKYYMGIPEVVKVVGWMHGVLFIAYIAGVFTIISPMKWNWFSVLVALAASLLPFGTLLLDTQLKRRLAELKGLENVR